MCMGRCVSSHARFCSVVIDAMVNAYSVSFSVRAIISFCNCSVMSLK